MINFPRRIYGDLAAWIKRPNRKPLIIKGARQVGKSHAVRTFARDLSGIDNFVELNLEQHESYRTFFKGDLDPQDIIEGIQLATGTNLKKPNSLLFIDEIQQEPRAITALRYFFEQYPQLPVIAAGSLIDFVLEDIGFPVGRIEEMTLHPFSFCEFLEALGKKHLAEFIWTHDLSKSVLEPVHNEILLLLKRYFCIGGLPEAVKSYYLEQDLQQVSRIQKSLLMNYKSDFPKYSKKTDWDALDTVFERGPLLVGSPRVKYTDFDKVIRGEKIKSAIGLLTQANILRRVVSSNIDKPPLRAGKEEKFFKIIFLDIGLMQTALGFSWHNVAPDVDLTDLKKGSLAEQFVGQELLANLTHRSQELFYWYRNAKSSNAEIDYLIESTFGASPVEVKSGALGRLKSLLLYQQLKSSKQSYILSQRNISQQGQNHFLPLYFAGRLTKL